MDRRSPRNISVIALFDCKNLSQHVHYFPPRPRAWRWRPPAVHRSQISDNIAKPTESVPSIGMWERVCPLPSAYKPYRCQPTSLLRHPRKPPHGGVKFCSSKSQDRTYGFSCIDRIRGRSQTLSAYQGAWTCSGACHRYGSRWCAISWENTK